MPCRQTLLWVVSFALFPLSADAADRVDFNRDIRPLFAAKCFACHGPDEGHREADLRLDRREVAVKQAIVPGHPEQSELMRRILSDDPLDQMPPPEVKDRLTVAQKQLFKRWIEEGAEYAKHWAFVPPEKPAIPLVQNIKWPRNEIDHFVLSRLEANGMSPSPEANRYELVRRVYLDLIGLPPSPEEADAFVLSDDPLAYEKLVDSLLASQQYGERWARVWLDLARYSDTNGYEKDRDRSIWPYRDWVIRALNDDMPFDQFTVEQLAGDMLPAATQDQIIATGFHRNTMLNEEGGIDPLEYRFYSMVDRVATTGTVWMGLSTGCAQCHTHKYDPITHTDYYSLMALMNNADEPDLLIKTKDGLAARGKIEDQIHTLRSELSKLFPPIDGDGPEQERRQKNLELQFNKWTAEARKSAHNWKRLVPTKWETNLPKLEVLEDGSLFSTGDITKRDEFQLWFELDEAALPVSAIRLEVLPDERLPAGGPGRAFYEGRKGDFFLSEVNATLGEAPVLFDSASHSYGKISIGSGSADAKNVFDGDGSTGWSTASREGESHQLVLNLKEPITHAGSLKIRMLFERHFAASLGRFRFSVVGSEAAVNASQLSVENERLLTEQPEQWSDDERNQLRQYYLSIAPEVAEARRPIEKLLRELPSFPTTLVMQERDQDNPRQTFRHDRGEFLNPKEEVSPGIPTFLKEVSKSAPGNRLELARWLVSDENPLVGRVTVNRAWQAFFGTGLHRTSADFGTQTDLPTHPELLDWLAVDFVDRGWSMKRLHRQIVTSATYRQSSRVTPELLSRDPQNELFARASRFPVSAEVVRDVMLKSSGLLSPKMYGPSVHPPQPASVTAYAYGNPKWNASSGVDRYRRSLYTFSKRTAPFAAYQIFNGPTGETCLSQRDRSNTPLQALTLLNDEMFLEMSREIGRNAASLKQTPEVTAKQIFRRYLTRPPEPEETATIVSFYQKQLQRLDAGELSATQIMGGKESTNEQAAWAIVARVLMNLDEVITRT
ncbi:MAG: PSD1 and planctomycete cytochrome C domain-containing protein [Planctomycetaceae bacterium]